LHAFPLHTLAINVVGSLLLGVLLERLARRGPSPSRTRLRLLLGTGALGGFTTYSALSVSTAQLLLGGFPAAAAAYALGTVVLGLLAAAVGIALSARLSGAAGAPSGHVHSRRSARTAGYEQGDDAGGPPGRPFGDQS
jgi:CrcB protein